MSDLPFICGRESELMRLMQQQPPLWRDQSNLDVKHIRSGFACALHMHQPTIPAGANGTLISHLQYMVEHPGEGDNHNAEPFAQCYRRMADLVPELISQGCNPRIMLDYSGNLLWGLGQMGREDITGALNYLACDPEMQRHVEGRNLREPCCGSIHATPDLKLQITAWRTNCSIVRGRVAAGEGFSPPEMHLPNHPDTLYQFTWPEAVRLPLAAGAGTQR